MRIFILLLRANRLLPLFIFCLLYCSGCKKFIEIGTAPTQVENAIVFSSDANAISAVTGLYSQLFSQNGGAMNGGMTVYPALSADELYNTSANANLDPFTSNSLLSTNSIVYANFWNQAYRHIFHANLLLEGLKDVRLSEATAKQLQGEVKIVRAHYYLLLVNLFGDVPLVLSSDYTINAVMPRTAVTTVYTQIIKDLNDAEQLLTETYPSSGKARPNKWTATALLARAYLYNGEWDKAEAKATALIQSGLYPLQTQANLANVFLNGSAETIWQLLRENNNTYEGSIFVPANTTTKPTYALRTELVNAFESGDKRKTEWTKSNVISGTTYYYPTKYKARTNSPITEYNILVRSAEQYLIRAEARTQQNNISGAQADLNSIRNRAGLANTTAATQAALLTAVEKERRIELMVEWGHRWIDLKRTNRADAVLGPVKTGWQLTAALYPIPFKELQLNPFLVQNPGYQ